MVDLKENLRPIGAYIKNRDRMLKEMFRCIRGSKLQAMLPDILKVTLSFIPPSSFLFAALLFYFTITLGLIKYIPYSEFIVVRLNILL
jgi:hypothetical protein